MQATFKKYFVFKLHQAQDEEKRQLVELRNVLKSVCDTENNTGKSQANVYSLHQLQVNNNSFSFF